LTIDRLFSGPDIERSTQNGKTICNHFRPTIPFPVFKRTVFGFPPTRTPVFWIPLRLPHGTIFGIFDAIMGPMLWFEFLQTALCYRDNVDYKAFCYRPQKYTNFYELILKLQVGNRQTAKLVLAPANTL
jgi:hypothetical protein